MISLNLPPFQNSERRETTATSLPRELPVEPEYTPALRRSAATACAATAITMLAVPATRAWSPETAWVAAVIFGLAFAFGRRDAGDGRLQGFSAGTAAAAATAWLLG